MAELLHERDFDINNYEEFYGHHYFKPVSDEDVFNAHTIFPRVAWALDVAQELKPKTILDLGCLEGYAALTLAYHVDSIREGVGVDLSEKAIELATKRTAALPVQFYKDSIEHYLSTTSRKFDLVMLFEVIEHVKDPKLVLKLIDKVLVPGGTVLVSTPAFESPTFGKDDEQNKCHIRLYTAKDEDYEEVNKYGNLRKATSITQEIGKERIISIETYSELLHVRYT